MALLDRFRTQARHKHPDAAVRLAFVQEIPLDERDLLAEVAREDADARVRRAAVAKLMDPAALAAVAKDDGDDNVRAQAVGMLRDIALEAFEGVGETESLAAVDALADVKTLVGIARNASRESTALRAMARVTESHSLGSIARHAEHESVRRSAFEALSDHAEILSVALNSEFRDPAVAAVERIAERHELDQIAARAKNKSAAKRARAIVREMDERAAAAAQDAKAAETATAEFWSAAAATAAAKAAEPDPAEAERAEREEADRQAARAREQAERAEVERQARETREIAARARIALCERIEQLQGAAVLDDLAVARAEWEGMPPLDDRAAHTELTRRFELAARACERRDAEWKEAERRRARLVELADEAARSAVLEDLPAARRQFTIVRREWSGLIAGTTVDPDVAARYAEADATFTARDAAAHEEDQRARREALIRVQQLVGRIEPIAARTDLSLKAGERALKEIRSALGAIPQLPSKRDFEETVRRLKAAQSALMPKVQELRDIADWQRWANVGIQEQLCEKMEAVKAIEDPEEIAKQVRELQQQWRQAADVPRAQGELLWRRFKAAHDEAWQRCESHFAAQSEARAENLRKKIALCERAESLADSTRWIQTADEIKTLQAEWKAIGAVTRGQEKTIWERFRSACDRFFTRRHADLADRKAMWAENLAKKDALCAKVEALRESTDWDATATAIKRLQVEWKAIGPVKKSRSEALWQRFRGACDHFFTRYAQRHDIAIGERVAAREAICQELEGLAADSRHSSVDGHESPVDGHESPVISLDSSVDAPSPAASETASAAQAVHAAESAVPNPQSEEPPADLIAKVRALRARWQSELAARGVDRDRAVALDERFATAFNRVLTRWPLVFGGTDLDPDSNRKRMEALVHRMEELAKSLAGPAAGAGDAALSPTTRLAAMLKEALAANTIGGKADDEIRFRAANDEVRQAQASWSRIGPVPEQTRRGLADRFQRAIRRITEAAATHIGSAAIAGGPGRPGGSGASGGSSRPR